MRIAAVTVTLSLLLAPALAGQSLTAGTWTGTVTPPEGGTLDVEYDVSYDDEQLAIVMTFQMGSYPFENIIYENGVLAFSWSPGVELMCELAEDEAGGFEGECVDAGGAPGVLTMTPPAG